MYKRHLEEIGLTAQQAEIYDFLSRSGPSSVNLIKRQTMIQRTLIYQLLAQLEDKQLVQRDNSQKVARFLITNPTNIEKQVENAEKKARLSRSAYDAVSDQLKQEFLIQAGQPGVRFYIGIDGLKKLYTDINQSEKEEIWIVRSRALQDKESRKLVTEQVEKQIRGGVKVHVINSTIDNDLSKYIDLDPERLTERRVIAHEVFQNPAQMIIYADKVGFTTYNKPQMTVVIQNNDIASTMRSMYELLWRLTERESEQNIAKINKKSKK